MDFSPFRKYSDTFIETGSCYGDGIQAALDAGFVNVRSVEVFQPLYLHCQRLFKKNPNVKIFWGKSVDHLKEMLSDAPTPSVFWLDAHPAGPNTGGHDDLMALGNKSEFMQDHILEQEIGIILRHGRHVLLIDDQTKESAERFKELINGFEYEYKFSLVDEKRGELIYKEKVLICEPM